ncbi:hypothetical protein Bca52824_095371, partial [Brassica carinata]
PFSYYDQSFKIICNLIGFTDSGELVYVPVRCYKSFYVLYYDPERNRFHRVEYKGIADDESRLKHGLVKSRLFNIPIVSNHMESLIRIQATPSIPLDVISEILSKLPTKSVGRFRCVSKLWSSVTTDPYFINRFETQSRQKKKVFLSPSKE